MRERNLKVLSPQLKWLLFADPEQSKDTKYSDTSAAFWNLYRDEAEISDDKLVKTLTGDTDSMQLLVRYDACQPFHTTSSCHHFTDHYILFHRRIFHHRDVQDSPP
jgi:hypothetical protein